MVWSKPPDHARAFGHPVPHSGIAQGDTWLSQVPELPLWMHALLLDPGGVLTARPYAFRTAAFRPVEAVGVFLCTTVRIILLSTTIPISGLDHMACVLATPGSVPLLAETHAGSLLTCWLGFRQVGLEPSPVLTHWATTTNFMGLLPLPRFRAYLGATTAGFGGGCWSLCVLWGKVDFDGRVITEPHFP